MTKSMMPLLEGTSNRGDSSGGTGDGGGSGRNMKPVQLPKTLRITAARASPNQSVRATILDRTRVNIKDDTTTRISKLTGRKQIHGKSRNMSNIRNRIRRSGKMASTSNRKWSTISSEDMNRRIQRSKRGQSGRMRRHMKRSSRVQNPWGCT